MKRMGVSVYRRIGVWDCAVQTDPREPSPRSPEQDPIECSAK